MKILIIGVGSIGSLFGAKLALAGNQVIVYTNIKISQYLSKHHMKLQDMENHIQEIENFTLAPPIEIFQESENVEFPDICIISAKSYDLVSICKSYEAILSKMESIILLQNGLGNEKIVHAHFPTAKVFRLITSFGAYLSHKGIVEHRGIGKTFLSSWSHDPTQIFNGLPDNILTFVNRLTSSGIPTAIAKDSRAEIWKKAFINIGINAIGALTNLPNEAIINIDELAQYCELAVQEAINVAKQLDVQLQNDNYYLQDVYNVIHATAENKNSMLQDFMRQNPTEIDFLNGKIVSYGKQLEIPTPINGLLTALIKGKEHSQK